jgi:predicted Zn-dependent protease
MTGDQGCKVRGGMVGVALTSKLSQTCPEPITLLKPFRKGSAMKTCKLWATLLLALALALPATFAFAQNRMGEITDAKKMLDSNPNANNRLRLATLQYQQGVDYLKSGDVNNAVDSMQASVYTLEDGKGQVPESNSQFMESRYGLAYALFHQNKPVDAQVVLEKLVASAPDYDKANYLRGAVLMASPGPSGPGRAVDAMVKLAQNGKAPFNDYGAHAATRYGYDLSTLSYARGDAAAAGKTLGDAVNGAGAGKGADAAENQKVEFAQGIYMRDAGDATGAVDKLEALYKENSGFQLNNGVALSGVLANAYYAAGLAQLQVQCDAAQQTALQMFDKAEQLGDPAALDVHHGKAIAYTKLNQLDKASDELKMIVAKDPSYYDKIKK